LTIGYLIIITAILFSESTAKVSFIVLFGIYTYLLLMLLFISRPIHKRSVSRNELSR
jgi:hypothetical protein